VRAAQLSESSGECGLRLLGIISFSAVGAHAERRVALVVGNEHYDYANTLRNPLNDAHDIATLLKSLGFDVLLGTDLDQRNFADDID
jgi:Caspase domain